MSGMAKYKLILDSFKTHFTLESKSLYNLLNPKEDLPFMVYAEPSRSPIKCSIWSSVEYLNQSQSVVLPLNGLTPQSTNSCCSTTRCTTGTSMGPQVFKRPPNSWSSTTSGLWGPPRPKRPPLIWRSAAQLNTERAERWTTRDTDVTCCLPPAHRPAVGLDPWRMCLCECMSV